MKIFGLYIYTRKGFEKAYHEKYKYAFRMGKESKDMITEHSINIALCKLQELRNDTWNQDKITEVQQWLESLL